MTFSFTTALSSLRRIAVVFIAGLMLMITTACSPADTTASAPSSTVDVPEATEAAVKRAQSNLSDQAIDEDVLSQQGPSRARQTESPVIAN